ncbi:hypothetical protein Tco_0048449, partial [Tanacetum coccineum]
HVNPATRRIIDQAAGKLRDRNVEESWALLDDLALYDNEIWNDPKDFDKPQAFVDYASSHNNEMGGKKLTTSQGPRNFNEATNAWKDKPDFNWARTQTFTSPQDGSFSTHSSSYQTKFERGVESEKFDNTPAYDTVGNYMARVNAISIDHLEKEAPRSKGIKSSSSSSPKRVYFINPVTVIRKEDEYRDVGAIESDAGKDISRNIIGEVEKKAEEGLDSSKIVIELDESRDIK